MNELIKEFQEIEFQKYDIWELRIVALMAFVIGIVMGKFVF